LKLNPYPSPPVTILFGPFARDCNRVNKLSKEERLSY
jgi:hypothetical protein